jgi:hypothetical protein
MKSWRRNRLEFLLPNFSLEINKILNHSSVTVVVDFKFIFQGVTEIQKSSYTVLSQRHLYLINVVQSRQLSKTSVSSPIRLILGFSLECSENCHVPYNSKVQHTKNIFNISTTGDLQFLRKKNVKVKKVTPVLN